MKKERQDGISNSEQKIMDAVNSFDYKRTLEAYKLLGMTTWDASGTPTIRHFKAQIETMCRKVAHLYPHVKRLNNFGVTVRAVELADMFGNVDTYIVIEFIPVASVVKIYDQPPSDEGASHSCQRHDCTGDWTCPNAARKG